MRKAKRYKCQGCSKMIKPVPGKRKNKYHDYACFAKQQARSMGLPPRVGKAIAQKQATRRAAAHQAFPRAKSGVVPN